MTIAATIKAPQARVLAVVQQNTSAMEIPQARVLSAYNIPAAALKADQARVLAVTGDPAIIELPQARVLAVVQGHIANPKIRAWTITLDGHDFYILNLGETETLVYDTHSEEWYTWGSDSLDLWRAVTGCNWPDGTGIASSHGSNIIVGDYINGVLYVLNPDQDIDDDPTTGLATRPFQRIVQGQVLQKGYNASRCYAVELLGSTGQLTDLTETGIQLEYSDDRGNSYQDAGTVNIANDDLTARASWRSLGSIYGPGRLFRITDYGALRRIDSLDMEGDE